MSNEDFRMSRQHDPTVFMEVLLDFRLAEIRFQAGSFWRIRLQMNRHWDGEFLVLTTVMHFSRGLQ